MNIEQRLREITQSHLHPDQDITRDSSFFKDLGADSLDSVELLISIEEAFGLDIDDSDWETVDTFGDAVDLITRLAA